MYVHNYILCMCIHAQATIPVWDHHIYCLCQHYGVSDGLICIVLDGGHCQEDLYVGATVNMQNECIYVCVYIHFVHLCIIYMFINDVVFEL